MELEQFELVIRKVYASEFWHKKDYLISQIEENGFENIKNAFFNLLYGSESLQKRYDDFRTRIKHIGPSMLTEIISFADPNLFSLGDIAILEDVPAFSYENN